MKERRNKNSKHEAKAEICGDSKNFDADNVREKEESCFCDPKSGGVKNNSVSAVRDEDASAKEKAGNELREIEKAITGSELKDIETPKIGKKLKENEKEIAGNELKVLERAKTRKKHKESEKEIAGNELKESEKGIAGNELKENEKEIAGNELKELEKEAVASARRESALNVMSYTWTVVSTLYAIVSVCYFISKGWVQTQFSYALIILLAAYVVAFVIIVALTFGKPKNGRKHLTYYRKFLKIFKAFANVLLLILSVVSMVGIASEGMSLVKWLVFVLTFLVAVVQLGLRIAFLTSGISRKRIAKKYEVKVERYVDGNKQKPKLSEKIHEKRYK